MNSNNKNDSKKRQEKTTVPLFLGESFLVDDKGKYTNEGRIKSGNESSLSGGCETHAKEEEHTVTKDACDAK